MNEGIDSQISQQRRDVMDALTKDELRYEIERGGQSRFCNTIPYLVQRLAKIEDEERAENRREDVRIAKAANTIAAKAHRLSKWAIFIAVLALLASIFNAA